MSAWLCPVKRRGWRIIRKERIFGAPRNAYKTMKKVRIGDSLVFYLLSGIKGIVAVYKVASDVYEDNSNIWGKYRYPFRVKILPICNLENSKKDLIPLNCIYGRTCDDDVVVEPFLNNIWITKMENKQYNILTKLINQR